MTNPALASTAIAVVPPAQAGMASGTNSTFRQVGIATGIAAFGAIFEHHIRAAFPGIRTDQLNAFASGRFTQASVPVPGIHHVQSVFISGLHELFVVGACVAAAGAVLALTLVRRRDFAAATAPAQG